MIPEIHYVCPDCKGHLRRQEQDYLCDACHLTFTTTKGLVDFSAAYSSADRYSLYRKAYGTFFDLLGPIYESSAWYQLTLDLSGARGNSIQSIADFVAQTVRCDSGRGLWNCDVWPACRNARAHRLGHRPVDRHAAPGITLSGKRSHHQRVPCQGKRDEGSLSSRGI